MRVASLGVARPTYYDRNSIEGSLNYQAYAVAPHADTTRWTYTVPAGKKAYVDSANAIVYRFTAATGVSLVNSRLVITPSGGSATLIVFAHIETNVVGDNARQNLAGSLLLLSGSTFRGITVDSSTGGTVDYVAAAHYIEFDA